MKMHHIPIEEFYSTREVLLEASMEEVKRVVAENCDFGNLDVRNDIVGFSGLPRIGCKEQTPARKTQC